MTGLLGEKHAASEKRSPQYMANLPFGDPMNDVGRGPNDDWRMVRCRRNCERVMRNPSLDLEPIVADSSAGCNQFLVAN
jgi:hypothetical protein